MKTKFTIALFSTIFVLLSACASDEKPIPEYKLIPEQNTLKINSTLYNNNNNNNTENTENTESNKQVNN